MLLKSLKHLSLLVVASIVTTILVPIAISASTYGSGAYGSCLYGSCSISVTVSSNGTVNVNVTPTLTGSCTIQSDTVSVLTDNSSGFTLTVANSSDNTALTNGGYSINATAGTFASPIALANNTWGYRVDNIGSFGAGPTTAESNVSPPSTVFAKAVANSQAHDTIRTTAGPANPAVETTVWYGVCANTATASGSYGTTVIYTAITN
jgi:hypothetical protein